MAETPRITARISPELVDEARAAAALPASLTVSEVIRYALAVIAGKPNPHTEAASYRQYVPEPPEIEQARRAYRASLTTGRRLSRERLARQFGITEAKARKIMAECAAADGAAA